MSNEISINSMDFITTVTKTNMTINNLNVKLEQWSNQGEKSESLQAFAEQFYELERTMELYKKLLVQDIDTIHKIGLEFFLSDFNLAKLWGGK